MAKILITGLAKQRISASKAVTSFINGHFSFGDTDGSSASLVQYNRTISKSTDTESTRTIMSTEARMSQNASGFSSTNIYHLKGYSGGLVTTSNKVTGSTDTQSSPTITLTVQRRGPVGPCPVYNGRIYYFGGYRDTDSTYRQNTTYITTSTDTPTDSTDITEARHAGTSLFNSFHAWLIGGLTTGNIITNTIFKWAFSTSSTSTLADTDIDNAQGYGLNYSIFGYRVLGSAATYDDNKKLTYATDTLSAGSSSPEYETIFGGCQYVTASTGYCWTGYRSGTLARTLHKLMFATETWADASYTTGDANSGWVTGTSGF